MQVLSTQYPCAFYLPKYSGIYSMWHCVNFFLRMYGSFGKNGNPYDTLTRIFAFFENHPFWHKCWAVFSFPLIHMCSSIFFTDGFLYLSLSLSFHFFHMCSFFFSAKGLLSEAVTNSFHVHSTTLRTVSKHSFLVLILNIHDISYWFKIFAKSSDSEHSSCFHWIRIFIIRILIFFRYPPGKTLHCLLFNTFH